jgi:hypothetical protein
MAKREAADWTLAQGKAGGNTTIIRALARVPLAEQRSARPVLVLVTWEFDGAATAGMPDRATYDRITDFEEVIFDSIAAEDWATEAAAITGNGAKQWRYYTNDGEDFAKRFSEALDGHPRYPVELEAAPDPEWQGLREVQPAA